VSDRTGGSGDGSPPSEPLRVLVVDDSVDIRFLVRLTLENDAWFVVVGEAGDGAEAIIAAGQLRPDVIILDLAMPVMDGLEALPALRAECPDARIVVLSGFNAGSMSAEALSLGASSYLEKAEVASRLVPHILRHFPAAQLAPTLRAATTQPAAGSTANTAVAVPDVPAELVSVLAHELQNPVTVLQGFAMILQKTETLSPETIKASAAAIGRAASHLRSLIEAFSDLRRIEVDALDLVLEPTDLAGLVVQTVDDLAEVTRTHTVVIDADTEVMASVDRPRVRQVIINLVANAVKFSPVGTRIEIAVGVSGSNAEVSVSDHGPGIPANRLSELFRKFSRLDSAVSGTGIGLYLSRSIARAHAGDLILVDSQCAGCCFALRLPLTRPHEGD